MQAKSRNKLTHISTNFGKCKHYRLDIGAGQTKLRRLLRWRGNVCFVKVRAHVL